MAVRMKADLQSVLILVLAVKWARGEYLGCFQDKEGKNRLMSDYLLDFDSLTPRRCTQLCTRLGYRFAGVQDRRQCFCGNDKPIDERRISESECNSPCTGNSKEICGGGLKSSVYAGDVLPPPEAVYMGCYEDNEFRILSEFRYRWDEISSPKKCIHLCKTLGFPYAGIEVGTECWCGKDRPGDQKKKNDTECYRFCPHTKHRCGGRWRLTMFTYPVDKDSQLEISDDAVEKSYLGCFQDNRDRILPDAHFNLYDINSPKKCLYICKQLGFAYAGVENSNGCHCGNDKPVSDLKRNENECSMSCPHREQKCGAEWRMGLYSTENAK